MSAYEPSDAAVEVAAEAMEEAAMQWLGRDLGTAHRDDIARAALVAAAPHMLATHDAEVLSKWGDVDPSRVRAAAIDGAAWSLLYQTMDTADRSPTPEDLFAAREDATRLLDAQAGVAHLTRERDAVIDSLAMESVGHHEVDASLEDTYGNDIPGVGCLCGDWLYDGNADPDEIDESFRVHVRDRIRAILAADNSTEDES